MNNERYQALFNCLFLRYLLVTKDNHTAATKLANKEISRLYNRSK